LRNAKDFAIDAGRYRIYPRNRISRNGSPIPTAERDSPLPMNAAAKTGKVCPMPEVKDEMLVRLATTVTKEAQALLKRECQRRRNCEARHVPLGTVLTDLIITAFRDEPQSVPAATPPPAEARPLRKPPQQRRTRRAA
jgi:hypothetical protein